MQIKVEAVAREARRFKNQTTWAVKFNNDWYDVHQAQSPKKGDILDGSLETQDSGGRTYRHFYPSAQSPTAAVSSNGHRIKMGDYEGAMRHFHRIAKELEPDDGQARTNLVQTALVALRDGKLELPPLDDAPPPAPFADDAYDEHLATRGDKDRW